MFFCLLLLDSVSVPKPCPLSVLVDLIGFSSTRHNVTGRKEQNSQQWLPCYLTKMLFVIFSNNYCVKIWHRTAAGQISNVVETCALYCICGKYIYSVHIYLWQIYTVYLLYKFNEATNGPLSCFWNLQKSTSSAAIIALCVLVFTCTCPQYTAGNALQYTCLLTPNVTNRAIYWKWNWFSDKEWDNLADSCVHIEMCCLLSSAIYLKIAVVSLYYEHLSWWSEEHAPL